MAQVPIQVNKPVSFRTNPKLWNKFKAKVYESGKDISTVMTKMIELFLEDKGFRERVLQELKDKGEN